MPSLRGLSNGLRLGLSGGLLGGCLCGLIGGPVNELDALADNVEAGALLAVGLPLVELEAAPDRDQAALVEVLDASGGPACRRS